MPNPPEQSPSADNAQNQTSPSVPVSPTSQGSADGTEEHSGSSRLKTFTKRAKAITESLGPFVVLIGLLYGAVKWIDHEIENKLTDEATLRKIASQIRPSLIFDGGESIVSDMGASAYVKDIKVFKETDPDVPSGWPSRIHIDFTRHIGVAPIVTPMSDSAWTLASRGKGHSWDFKLVWIVQMGDTNDTARVYRLELFP